jgi:hypothetical protein
MNVFSSAGRKRKPAERLDIACRLYQALAAQDPDRVITLRDGSGRVVARHDPRPEPHSDRERLYGEIPACRKTRKTTGEKPIVMRLRDAFAQSPTALNAASGAITPLSDHDFSAG